MGHHRGIALSLPCFVKFANGTGTTTLQLMQSVHTPAYRAFLQRLVAARVKAGLAQGEVARLLRMPQSRLSRMESGERLVDVLELDALARVYRKPLSYFVPRSR
jgi:DNA-binding transcriptional regulator YiaG